jgi:hypothetical protein
MDCQSQIVSGLSLTACGSIAPSGKCVAAPVATVAALTIELVGYADRGRFMM